MVLLGQLLRASSFPGTLAHEEILPHHHWVDFSTCNRRAVRSPNREQERPEQVKPVCQCTIIAKLNFFYPEKSKTILALHIYYRHTSSRYSLETTHEMTLSSVKITFTVLSSLILYIGKCENNPKVELKFNSLIYGKPRKEEE